MYTLLSKLQITSKQAAGELLLIWWRQVFEGHEIYFIHVERKCSNNDFKVHVTFRASSALLKWIP